MPKATNRLQLRAAAVFLAALTLFLAACSIGVQGYRDFRSAVDSGATCAQLIDINEDNFVGTADEDRVERDLRELGCVTRSSTRTDEE